MVKLSGIGILVNINSVGNVVGVDSISNSIGWIVIRLYNRYIFKVIHFCASAYKSTNEEIEGLYDGISMEWR